MRGAAPALSFSAFRKRKSWDKHLRTINSCKIMMRRSDAEITCLFPYLRPGTLRSARPDFCAAMISKPHCELRDWGGEAAGADYGRRKAQMCQRLIDLARRDLPLSWDGGPSFARRRRREPTNASRIGPTARSAASVRTLAIPINTPCLTALASLVSGRSAIQHGRDSAPLLAYSAVAMPRKQSSPRPDAVRRIPGDHPPVVPQWRAFMSPSPARLTHPLRLENVGIGPPHDHALAAAAGPRPAYDSSSCLHGRSLPRLVAGDAGDCLPDLCRRRHRNA